ncbi:MAG: DUF938 domain-containing protein [Alphaproteobacteria bacterium]|nr:DUF938 domain-containing protein [Alphaproteobacteria bacterium]MBO6861616.1 DUF938 domain-containing protein [Alphaproteobacteria bacterium]
MSSTGSRRHAPATLRNRDAILSRLTDHLPQTGTVLEIASGTGEHAAYFAPRLPDGLVWCPSDLDPAALADIDGYARESGCARIAPAQRLDVAGPDWAPDRPVDAIFCANMIHIAPWAAACGLIGGAGRLLPPGGPLLIYGPFSRDGRHTAPSNADFDASLRARDPAWGVRDLEGDILPVAAAAGLRLRADVPMPANNFLMVFEKKG